MKFLNALIWFLLLSQCVLAQTDSVVFKNFQLRQSFETADTKSEPAQLQLSFPHGGKESWLLNAGISVKVLPLSWRSYTSKLVAEYHRNNQINEEQNNLQFGYGFRWFERSARKNIRSVITGNLKYVRDVIDSVNSFALTGNYTLYNKNRKGFKWNAPGYIDDEDYTYRFTPYIGFEFQQLLSSNAFTRAGPILRPLANISLSFSRNRKFESDTDRINKEPSRLVELVVSYTGRYALINNTGNDEGYSKLLNTGINYYFIDNKKLSASLGGTYTYGSNPLAGLKQQQFWQISLQIEI